MSKKKFIVLIGFALITALLFLNKTSLFSSNKAQVTTIDKTAEQSTDEIRLISTKPEGLLESSPIILPTQAIEVTFNQPLENRGELKRKISPEVEIEVNLTDDRKTAIIKPKLAYPAGPEFSLIIQGDSKFDGKKELGKEYILHFKTIPHKGI